MKAIQILCLATLLVLAGCHRTSFVVDQPRNFPGVLTRDVTFYSSALGRKMTYRVYLPSEIRAGAKLPAAYLLHGCGGSYRDWSNDSDVGAYAAHGLILVMVDGDCSYYMNAVFAASDRYEDYFVHDVLADTETRFPVESDRAHRAVVGVSMGGFAAIELALTRADVFSFAGAISPAIDVPGRGFSLRRWGQSMRFRTIFGPTGSERRNRTDPFRLVTSTDPSEAPYLYITAGDNEPLLSPIRRFAGLLRQRHFSYEFHTKPGGHDWSEWSEQVPGCFTSLIAHLHRP